MPARLLLAHNPGPYTGEGNNTYLLSGRVPVLIDCGVGDPRHLDAIAAAVAEAGPPDRTLAAALVTHGHPDHAGGAAALAGRWPTAAFRKYPWPGHDAAWRVDWQAVRDDEQIEAGEGTLWAIHTPGHSPDHVCFFDPLSGTLFGGDLVVNGGTVFIPASSGGDVAQYLASLGRILDLRPRRILAGHGAPVEQPGALLRGYIAHRLERERQIVAALRPGPLTVEQIVDRVYPELDAALRDAAIDGVMAHLVKLRGDHRVAEDLDGAASRMWRVVPGSD